MSVDGPGSASVHRESITDAAGYMCGEIRWGKHWVYRDDPLEESWALA